jgi:hypothetical protein
MIIEHIFFLNYINKKLYSIDFNIAVKQIQEWIWFLVINLKSHVNKA